MAVSSNILILGHSFTKRLQRWCVENHRINMNLDHNRFQVYWHGISGGNLKNAHHPKSIWSDAHLVFDLQVDIVFLDIGSNDLCDPSIHPEDLVQQLLEFTKLLISQGCMIVVVSEILHRQTPGTYNANVDRTNSLLCSACRQTSSLYFWTHSRNNFNRCFLSDYVAHDGVHVDSIRGMPLYYSSVRGALLYADTCIRPF